MKNNKLLVRLLLLCLCLAMLGTAFVSCADKNGPDEEQPTRPPREEETEDENGFIYVSPNVNYNNDEFNIYTWTGTDEWVLDIDETTSSIDSEIFYHFCNVEDELGIIFNIAQEVSGGWGNHETFVTNVATLTGADNIDLICQYSLSSVYGVLQGCYVNLAEVNYINWDAPYWSDDLRQANTLNDKIFYCSGEISPSVVENMFLMIFNYTLAENYGLGDLYATVRSKDWTVAKLREMTTNIYQDLNNNEESDIGDRFGLVVATANHVDPLQYGCDLPLLTVSEMGELEVNPNASNEYGIDVTAALVDLLHTNPGAYVGNSIHPSYADAMKNGNAVFQVCVASDVISTLSASEINYGILPMPKYTKEQKDYYTCLSMVYSMFSIPTAANNPDQCGAVLEALAHDGYANLTPFIFEESLKSRYSKRPEDAEMFDILRGGVVYEPGRIMANIDIFSLIRNAVAENESLTVRCERKLPVAKAGIVDVAFAFS